MKDEFVVVIEGDEYSNYKSLAEAIESAKEFVDGDCGRTALVCQRVKTVRSVTETVVE